MQENIMKILVVTDHYYPDIHGGYEVGCSLVTEELMRRGHDITVLTSDFNAPAIAERKNIFRILPCSKSQVNSYFLNILHSLYKEIKSFFILKRFFKKYNQFDIIYVWSTRGIFTTMLLLLENLNIPVVHYLFDTWATDTSGHSPIGWFKKSGRFAFVKCLLKYMYSIFKINPLYIPEFKHPQFCSSVIKSQFTAIYGGIDRPIIHFGMQIEKFPFNCDKKMPMKKIVWLGRPCDAKGFHIAFEAVTILKKSYPDITFDIYGGFDSKEQTYVKDILNKYGNPDYVYFHSAIPHEQIPQVLPDYDFLIFSSMWNEPYGLVPLEAMAAGVVVLTTADGGSIDYSHDGENCVFYIPEDANDCAEKIKKLLQNNELYNTIRFQARSFVEKEMLFSTTIDIIEADLAQIAQK